MRAGASCAGGGKGVRGNEAWCMVAVRGVVVAVAVVLRQDLQRQRTAREGGWEEEMEVERCNQRAR
jgi:hypothetical protein